MIDEQVESNFMPFHFFPEMGVEGVPVPFQDSAC
jgi:hypothetical protein